MTSGSVTLSLPQMIDLSLNFPDYGSVNYNVMRSLLHVLVQQLELVQCQVEFKGKDGDRIQSLMTTLPTEPSIKLTEYVVSPAKDAGKVVNRKPSKKPEEGEQKEGVIDIDKIDGQESLHTIVLVEPTATGSDAYEPCLISQQRLKDMEQEITSLKEKLQELSDLPGNKALIDALRGAGIEKETPVLDMFHMMTLSKKVEATEGGIEKLASMVEDLAKHGGLGDLEDLGQEGGGGLGGTIKNMADRLAGVEKFLEDAGHVVPTGAARSSGQDDAADPTKDGSNVTAGDASPKPGAQYAVDLGVTDLTTLPPADLAAAVTKEIKKLKIEIKLVYDKLGMLFDLVNDYTPDEIAQALTNVVKKYKTTVAAAAGAADTSDLPPVERIDQLEDRFNGTNEQIASLDSSFNHEINNLHSQFAEMEKAFGSIMEKIHFGLPGGDSPGGGETFGELFEKLMSLQSDMENLAETASKLLEDKEDKQRMLEVLTEQVEFLKTVKADKEDLEDALADKADACAINRKVSHDQFDTACDELSRGIEEALGKLTQQEELWQQALDEIQKEIGNKLDRMELGPLRDFVNNKLKMLQQRLKALTALKQETEAAGTKKFLRNVNCISCDKDVVMRKEMDPSLLPQPYAMPPSRSMGPYLAYELDALRKQQKSLPNSRNLNYFENALHQKSPRPGEDHICNRYCGGSHTITTPQQRVTRLGHFLNQWGPEAQAVTEGGKPKEKEEEIAVVGQAPPSQTDAVTPRVSKIESAEKDLARKSSQTQDRKSISTEKRPSKSTPRTGSVPSVKGSGEVAEKRQSSVGSAQKVSQSSIKRTSQSSAKSGGTVQPEEKAASRLSNKIPEETPSEVAKEAAEDSPKTGDEAAAPTSPKTSQPGSKQASQTVVKQASQASAKQASQPPSKPASQAALKPASQAALKPASQPPSKQPSQTTPRPSAGQISPKGSARPSVVSAKVSATPRASVQKSGDAVAQDTPAEAPASNPPPEE